MSIADAGHGKDERFDDVAARRDARLGLLDGKVDYPPEPLDAPADGNILISCRRPANDLVVDI